jgi:hypothetical protein
VWSLNQSELVINTIKEGYKSRTTKDPRDANIPLSVQPWGKDGDKRRYWLIEGQDDTPFRVYRESNPALKHVSWRSAAGSIDEIRALAQKLEEEDGTREAKALGERMLNAIPRFEATEEVKRPSHSSLHTVANTLVEAQEAHVPSRTEGQVGVAPSSRLFSVRRSHPWQARAVYVR